MTESQLLPFGCPKARSGPGVQARCHLDREYNIRVIYQVISSTYIKLMVS